MKAVLILTDPSGNESSVNGQERNVLALVERSVPIGTTVVNLGQPERLLTLFVENGAVPQGSAGSDATNPNVLVTGKDGSGNVVSELQAFAGRAACVTIPKTTTTLELKNSSSGAIPIHMAVF